MFKDITSQFKKPKDTIITFGHFNFNKGSISCVYGIEGVGKSSFLLKLADIALCNGIKTLFIDTEGKIDQVPNSILQRRMVQNKEVYTLFKIVVDSSNPELPTDYEFYKGYDLILIDSASKLLSKYYGKEVTPHSRKLMEQLRRLSSEKGKTIIFSAQAYPSYRETSSDNKIPLIVNRGGRLFHSETDESILISQPQNKKQDRRIISFKRAMLQMSCEIADGDIINIQ